MLFFNETTVYTACAYKVVLSKIRITVLSYTLGSPFSDIAKSPTVSSMVNEPLKTLCVPVTSSWKVNEREREREREREVNKVKTSFTTVLHTFMCRCGSHVVSVINATVALMNEHAQKLHIPFMSSCMGWVLIT